MSSNGARARAVAAALVAVALVGGFTAAMVPLRSHLSVATTALVLVVPVVLGVALGGFWSGIAAAASGFLVYDFVFIPPYYTLRIGALENWTALGVYGIVTVVVARVVAQVNHARAEAQQRAIEVRRLFDLSELLVREASTEELLERVVAAVQRAFSLDGAALLLPVEDRLRVVASVGVPVPEPELSRLEALTPGPVRLQGALDDRAELQTLALVTSGRPLGLLVLQGGAATPLRHEQMRAFTNQLALALERAQLREQALRAQLLEEVDRLRRSLVGAVSHDLRTPLATIKVSASTLLDPESRLTDADARELIELVDLQADRLERLVANLLDMTRIQSGTLELRADLVPLGQLVDEAVSVLGAAVEPGRLSCQLSPDLPPVEADPVLVTQVLANLVDNALRYSADGAEVTVSARLIGDGKIEVAVTDRGPGIPADERAGIFHIANPRAAGGRGGLGLAIARAFVEAHGERIWVEGGPGGTGARFAFTLPTVEPARVR